MYIAHLALTVFSAAIRHTTGYTNNQSLRDRTNEYVHYIAAHLCR